MACTLLGADHFGIVACMPPVDERSTTARELAVLLGPVEGLPGPRYAGMARRIRDLVTAGHLPVGSRLPAERELAAELDLSRVTVASAYRVLRDEGFASTRHGSGTVTELPGPGASWGLPQSGAGVLDLAHAAPEAAPQLLPAYEAALAELPRYLDGHGYAPSGCPPCGRRSPTGSPAAVCPPIPTRSSSRRGRRRLGPALGDAARAGRPGPRRAPDLPRGGALGGGRRRPVRARRRRPGRSRRPRLRGPRGRAAEPSPAGVPDARRRQPHRRPAVGGRPTPAGRHPLAAGGARRRRRGGDRAAAGGRSRAAVRRRPPRRGHGDDRRVVQVGVGWAADRLAAHRRRARRPARRGAGTPPAVGRPARPAGRDRPACDSCPRSSRTAGSSSGNAATC